MKSFPTLWRWLALLCVMTVLHAGIYVSQRTISAGLIGLVAFVCLITLAVISVSLWLNPERLLRVQKRAAPLETVYSAAALLLLIALGALLRPEWLYTNIAIIAVLAAALTYHTFFADGRPISRAAWGIAVVVLLLVLALRVATLGYVPFIDVQDEGWTLSWAQSAAETGVPVDRLMLGLGSTQIPLPRFYSALGIWVNLLGVGLWQARLFSFILVLAIVGFTALAARNWFGRRAAVLTALALLASPTLLTASRIRHDVGLALSIAIALWLFTVASRRGQRWIHLAAGLAFGTGLFSHYHALLIAPAIAIALYGPETVTRVRRRRLPAAEAWLFVAGVTLMFGLVVLVQVGDSASLFVANRSAVATGVLVSSYFGTIVEQIGRLVQLSMLESALLAIALGATLMRFARSRRPADLAIALLPILGLLALGVSAPIYYYLIPLTPAFGLLLGAFFDRLVGPPETQAPLTRSLLVGVMAAGPLLGSTLPTALSHLASRDPILPRPPPAAQWVLDNLPPSATVAGEHYYNLWLYDYRFATPGLLIFANEIPGSPEDRVYPVWDAVDVDVFIVDLTLASSAMMRITDDSGYLQERDYRLSATLADDIRIYTRPSS
ncbi:MAG: glycosyltransferase family 39 protein [Chloroflexi bacterium]|nr:glycosyltransferase family 39 protein [Chloroflexota bacterium]